LQEVMRYDAWNPVVSVAQCCEPGHHGRIRVEHLSMTIKLDDRGRGFLSNRSQTIAFLPQLFLAGTIAEADDQAKAAFMSDCLACPFDRDGAGRSETAADLGMRHRLTCLSDSPQAAEHGGGIRF